MKSLYIFFNQKKNERFFFFFKNDKLFWIRVKVLLVRINKSRFCGFEYSEFFFVSFELDCELTSSEIFGFASGITQSVYFVLYLSFWISKIIPGLFSCCNRNDTINLPRGHPKMLLKQDKHIILQSSWQAQNLENLYKHRCITSHFSLVLWLYFRHR